MTKDKALKMALEALQNPWKAGPDGVADAIIAIKEALAQPEQEPVATLWQHGETGRTRITMPDDITDCDARWFKAADLYTSPPQRTWVNATTWRGLTEEDLKLLSAEWRIVYGAWMDDFARDIEAKLKEKNNG